MRKLTIDRKVWFRGSMFGSRLLRDDEKMCCLGIYLESCGVKREDLLKKLSPKSLIANIPMEAQWLIERDSNSDLAKYLIEVNDNESFSDQEREHDLILFFAQAEVEVEFTN